MLTGVLLALVQAGSDTVDIGDAPARNDGASQGQNDDLPTLSTCDGEFVAGRDPRTPPSPLPSVAVVVPEIRQVQRMEWSAEKEAQKTFTATAEATDTPIVFSHTPYVVLSSVVLSSQERNVILGMFDACLM